MSLSALLGALYLAGMPSGMAHDILAGHGEAALRTCLDLLDAGMGLRTITAALAKGQALEELLHPLPSPEEE